MFSFTMTTRVLLLVCFLDRMSVEARPQITSFGLLQGSTRWDIGEPRILPDLDDIQALLLPHSIEKFKSAAFSYCNKLMTLNPHEVFTVTFPVDRKSCLIYLKAPKGYLLEQRSHPIVRFASCDKEQLRFSSGLNTLVYCNGGHPVHFQGDQEYLAIMYAGITPNYRQEIKFAVSVKPVASSLPGSTRHLTTGTSELLWRDPAAEYKPKAVLELARQDDRQICPKTCGASNEDGAYRLVRATLAEEGELPYMVRIVVDYKPRGYTNSIRITCGGSILNSRNVLTAAHCLLDKEKLGWNVVGRKVYTADFNDNERSSQGQAIAFDKFVVHPEYKSRMADDATKSYRAFDIAVLELSEDLLMGPNSWPICLAPGLDFMNKHATISGYGRINQYRRKRDEDDQPSEGLWKAGVVIADYDKKCQEFDRFKLPANLNRKACTFGMTKEACLGDMGSPLAVAEDSVWYQVGVATGGFCGLPGEPHFHVNVTTFADFIKRSVHGGKCH